MSRQHLNAAPYHSLVIARALRDVRMLARSPASMNSMVAPLSALARRSLTDLLDYYVSYRGTT